MAQPDPDPNAKPDPTKPSPEQEAAFQDWFKNTIQAHPEKYDPAHFTEDQARNWFPLWTGNGFKSSKLDANGKPIEGDNFEHPDACPEGTQAWGQNQCLPNNDRRVTGQPGPSQGPGPSGEGNNSLFMNPEMLAAMRDLEGNRNFWNAIVNPQDPHSRAENFALTSKDTGDVNDAIDSQRQNIIASMPPGGERDKALWDL